MKGRICVKYCKYNSTSNSSAVVAVRYFYNERTHRRPLTVVAAILFASTMKSDTLAFQNGTIQLNTDTSVDSSKIWEKSAACQQIAAKGKITVIL